MRGGDGKPLSCGGTRPLREVAQPVHAKRAAQGEMVSHSRAEEHDR